MYTVKQHQAPALRNLFESRRLKLKANWANRLFVGDVSGHPDVCETDAGMEAKEEHERQVDVEDDRPSGDAVEL